MQKIEMKAHKTLSLSSETIRNLRGGETTVSYAPTIGPGCSSVPTRDICQTHGC